MTIDEVLREDLSPMMQQYYDIKKQNMDSIVFYRVGDFYEMFFEDAYVAARELELQLTGKDASMEERVPMAGIPFHAYQIYALKLLDKGYKIAIVEQTEDPAKAKGLVKRDVIKILTPGTTVDSDLNSKTNNYIVSLSAIKKGYAFCYCDASTGDVYITKVVSSSLLFNEILSIHAKEVVISSQLKLDFLDKLNKNYGVVISHEDEDKIPDYLEYVGEGIDDELKKTLGILLNYLTYTIKSSLVHLKNAIYYESKDYLRLDPFTRRNLELTETLRQNQQAGSLLWLLDKCQTAMGSRMLRLWIERPLINPTLINKRLDFVETLTNDYLTKEEIKSCLKTVYDLERIVGRISLGNANAKDLVQLKKSLSNIPALKDGVLKLKTPHTAEVASLINTHSDLYQLLESALKDDVPLSIKEGGMIKEGYNSELDELKNISKNSKDWILNYEKKVREETGISGLKVGYNRVFGYYIEVTKSYLPLVKEEFGFERKQTLANAERYITEDLKKYEHIIVGADEKIINLEYDLFCKLRENAKKYSQSLQVLANAISMIDCFVSFSEVAVSNNYVRPEIIEDRKITIINGRHPVVEKVISNSEYVENDVIINEYNTLLITGPNMSGKSTYMRQLALISIMSQIGSFVPASTAKLCIFDQIFTRIGASDDLISGQSTFMVEMSEANYAIKNATKNSLILFDELGRGTSTYDGMAIAQAIIEYIHDKISCVMLFSTHYHELQELELKLKHLKNVHVSAKETKDSVVFLHKVLDGGADKSYGINVAKLAGLPKSLIERANNILGTLEDNNFGKKINLDLFNFDDYESKEEVKEENSVKEICEALDSINVDELSPRDALNFLYELKKMR